MTLILCEFFVSSASYLYLSPEKEKVRMEVFVASIAHGQVPGKTLQRR